MANKDLKLSSHNLPGGTAWWYEKNGGILFVHQNRIGQIFGLPEIKWKDIRAALKRKDKK